MRAWPWLAALGAMALFAFVGVRHLDAVPQVYEDEPWQASTAYKLMTAGVFGSDLFAGFYHMDQRYYGFMPLHPLLLAAVFKALGVGQVQARLETVSLSLLTLGLTFALALRLYRNAWVGALAVVVLVFVRWTGLTYVQLSGIPLVDFARIARYDPLVPVLGLASLHVYLTARQNPRAPFFVSAGALAGLSGIAHVYGLFWVPALLLLALWDRRPKSVIWMSAGAVLSWLPYAAYVLADLPDWRGQTAIYASRFELLTPRWYVDNLLQEYHRYGPGLGPLGTSWLLRPGFWLCVIALPLSLWALGRRALRCDPAARAVIVPAVLFPVLFGLAITLKLVNYTLIELPLFAIAIAWGVTRLWQRTRMRPVLGALATAVLLEGVVALVRLDQATATTTPYATFISEIRTHLPAGARVLGLHRYWLGLEDFDYRSFLVPLNWADEGLPLDQGLTQVDPDVVLLDARMRDYFAVSPDGPAFYGWLQLHSSALIGRIDDPTYGLMEIYRITR
jgi:hypothetical protein